MWWLLRYSIWILVLGLVGIWLWTRRLWIRAATEGPYMFYDPRTTFHAFSELHKLTQPSIALTVVIPVNSEAANQIQALARTIHEAMEYFLLRQQHEPQLSFEILVASTARSADVWSCVTGFSARAGVNVVRLYDSPWKFSGIGAATALGMKLARGQYILVVPPDNSVTIRNIERLETVMYSKERANLGIVIGDRGTFLQSLREKKDSDSFWKNILQAFSSVSIFGFLSHVLTWYQMDLGSQFVLFTRKTLLHLLAPGLIEWIPLSSRFLPSAFLLAGMFQGTPRIPLASAPLNDVNQGPILSLFGFLYVIISVTFMKFKVVHEFIRRLLFLKDYNVWNLSRPSGSL